MKQVYSKLSITKNAAFFSIVLALCIGIALFFHPRIAAIVFPSYQTKILDTFLASVQQNKAINAKEFWKFREFYSPASAYINTNAITFGETQIITTLTPPTTVLMTFKAPYMESTDYIVPSSTSFESILAQFVPEANTYETFFSSSSERIFLSDPTHVHVLFIKPISEMRQADGFFDYKDAEQKLLSNSLWLSVSKISLHSPRSF